MLTSLKTRSLEELKKEPRRLEIQADSLTDQLRNLVLKNYHVFIESYQCAAIVKDNIAELKKETLQLETAIPEVEEYCTEFQKEVGDIVNKNGDIQYVFEHYLPLMELLEIPQLLQDCIDNEIFDSALDILKFANEIFLADENAQTTSHNKVLDCLVQEVADMSIMMREKLLQKLREDLQLALCVKIVGYLRRLDALVRKHEIGSLEYEKQLKDEFLSCRNIWLASLSQRIVSSDPYQYIVQLIDIKRTSWFDLITQYSAIFGSENVDGKVDPPLCRWATTTVADFLNVLMKQLPKIDEFSSIATIFEQSLFFGGSLGRVGVDFRAVLVVSFEDHVLKLMTENWRAACHEFQGNLSAHSLAASSGSCSPSTTPLVIPSYRSAGEKRDNPFASRPREDEEDYSPPRSVMMFPLLAEFTNTLISSLNELRLCIISSLQNRLSRQYQRTIGTMLRSIAEFVKENGLDLDATSEEKTSDGTNGKNSKTAMLTDAIRTMIQVIHTDLVPYLLKCFHRLYPSRLTSASSALSKELGEFEVIMREAGLLYPQPADENETKAVVTKNAQLSDSTTRDQSVDVVDSKTTDCVSEKNKEGL
ncbi:hypothetical protein PsorP6_008119 [Peronosclerospora sorghi]|uniref:Uncharacterized protein n=1 Tax=Peronosclerospora sorghi TaxID=230839 RepID=A0ACC0W743_9STRA|nr:hypothetical protein PsorP6_008119 [Peronosclerospora sorghi]